MSIDALLYRPIAQQSQFEGLIPPYQGQEVSFDKESDNSTTYDTLKYMDQWATKYAYQMKTVAPRLKGRDLKETVAKIYLFLYSHFQYKLDGSLQNLYSPSAAWYFRHKGFDCKTYSILASTILRNLNIPHTFRMVQQAGIMPGQWSHVYVIVSDKKTNYVIDATTHTNKEVSYKKKYDYNMIHRGLASPYPYGTLNCACQGIAIQKNVGLGAPSNLEATIANFHVFLNELEKKGFPREVTDKMLYLVKSNIENGIDPNFHEIVQKAILSESKLGELSPVSLLNPTGTTFNLSPTASPLSIQGVSTTGIMSSITGLITGNPLAAIGLITSLVPIEKTFGAVFANGFDLSCWGASYSEQKAKVFIEKRVPELVKESGIESGIVTTAILDRFLNLIDVEIFWARNGQQPKYASCTRKGYALQEKTFQTLMVNTLEQMRKVGYQLIPNGKKPTTIPNQQSSYDSYVVIAPSQAIPAAQQQANPEVPYYDANGNKLANDAPVKSSSNTPLILGGAALLALKLLI